MDKRTEKLLNTLQSAFSTLQQGCARFLYYNQHHPGSDEAVEELKLYNKNKKEFLKLIKEL